MSSTGSTEKDHQFDDFDLVDVYNRSRARVLHPQTKNFVVEFGKKEVQIAFDLLPDAFGELLKKEHAPETPVRWINIWAPNRQTELIDLIDEEYKFSARLSAIIKTAPPTSDKSRDDRHGGRMQAKLQRAEDVERAIQGNPTKSQASVRPDKPRSDATHYGIARQMKHYHSVDFGARFLCIGANWMHELPSKDQENEKDNVISEGKHRAFWSWLILCDDHTVISLHEDTSSLKDEASALESIRGNTLSVLSQLSNEGHESADPISLQTVRQALVADHGDPGIEGSSSLFYYLFDDWRAVYSIVGNFHYRLDELHNAMMITHIQKPSYPSIPMKQIIPRLHMLGRQFRQMDHLYTAYKNLITRITAQKPAPDQGRTTPRSFSGLSAHHRGVTLAPNAVTRFERLSDRIELLILSEIREFTAEKEALVATYFNITAQKDSEATARLTRAATLLAKLSVLFLPVSLMTAYFSIQIKELEGVYTTKDYWYSFAVIMTISVLGLFFFAKALMWVTETLDQKVTGVGKSVRKIGARAVGLRRRKATPSDADDDKE